MPWTLVLLLAAGLAGGSAIVALGVDPVDPKIERWGPFKFGTTLKEVRKMNVPGVRSGRLDNYDYRLASLHVLESVAAFGSNYRLILRFGWGQRLFARDKRLSRIDLLTFDDTTANQARCERKFRDAVFQLERYYGPLTATEAPGKRPGPGPRDETEVTVVRLSKSAYSRTDTDMGILVRTPLMNHDTGFEAERHADGAVLIGGAWSKVGQCRTWITVFGKEPANTLD